MIFNTFVFLQIFNEINSRIVTDGKYNIFQGIHRNFIFLGVIIGTIIVQVLIVEFGGKFCRTEHLEWDKWLTCIGLGALSIPFGTVLRFIPVPEERHVNKKENKDKNEEELEVLIK